MKKAVSILLAFFMVLALSANVVLAEGMTISQASMTIETGQTARLTVNKENTIWVSSNPSVASVDQSGNVTGKAKGSTVITVTDHESSAECVVSVVAKTTKTITRYNVLIIDTSSSIKGKPFTTLKSASKKFAKKVLSADGKNYVAVVALNKSSKKVLGFSKSISQVNKAIDGLKAGGKTNMNAALVIANRLLKSKKNGSKVIKNIILCSDGLPYYGKKKEKGRYSKKDYKHYALANATYNTDVKSKKAGYFVYALGFFHNSKGNNLVFGKRLMKDLASKDKYYVITKASDVNKALNTIANTITRTTCSKSSIILNAGESTTLKCLVNGVSKKASWKSANSAVATVSSSGKVTGVKAGKTTITGTYNGQSCKCIVTVKNTKKTNESRLYWVIFREGFRSSRIEKSTFTSSVSSDDLYIVWNSSMTLNNTTGMSKVSQYHLTDDGLWNYDRNYGKLTDWATDVIASNLDIRDKNGKLLLAASESEPSNLV